MGQNRYYDITEPNHRKLIDKIKQRHVINEYNFLKTNDDSDCPYNTSGEIQVYDFLKIYKEIKEDYFLKLRSDLYFTDTSIDVIINYLDKVINNEIDGVFIGLDFRHYPNKPCVELPYHGIKKTYDWVFIGKKHIIDDDENIFNKTRKLKIKNGNRCWTYVCLPNTKIITVSTQIYLIRKDYNPIPTNHVIYSEFTKIYAKKCPTSYSWVLKNQEKVNLF